MYQARHTGVRVAWNEWVCFDDMGPWLSKSAQNLYSLNFLLVTSRSFSYNVSLVGCSPRISMVLVSIGLFWIC